MKFFYGPCGALVCDQEIAGVTQELMPDTARFYGGTYFVGESFQKRAAEIIAKALGGEMVEQPFEKP